MSVDCCPHCKRPGPHESKGIRRCRAVGDVRRRKCKGCKKVFTERTGTVLAGLRTPAEKIASALHARSEGVGVRGTGRLVGVTHGAVIGWERRIEKASHALVEVIPDDFVAVIESDEVYTKVHSNKPPSESEGWTACGIERASRFCTPHTSGRRDELLFKKHTMLLLALLGAAMGHFVSDGETRYASELWKHPEATTTLSGSRTGQCGRPKGSLKALRKGVTVRRKVKGSQKTGPKKRERYETPLRHHPESQPLADRDVHCNHSEAYNASLRRRCSAFRRRTNMYAKTGSGLGRALSVQRVIYNYARPHWAHENDVTPAQVIGLAGRKWSLIELTQLRT